MIDPEDSELVEIARDLIKKRFKADRHHIAAALRTASGNIYSGVHIEV